MKSTIFIKHTGRDLLKSSQQAGGLSTAQLFEHFGESQHAQTTEAVLQAGLLPAQERRKGHFAKVAGRLKKSFRRPTCHAYDYAALIVPTAVCICIGMHAVKRRNRTHEIHNLHKTHTSCAEFGLSTASVV